MPWDGKAAVQCGLKGRQRSFGRSRFDQPGSRGLSGRTAVGLLTQGIGLRPQPRVAHELSRPLGPQRSQLRRNPTARIRAIPRQTRIHREDEGMTRRRNPTVQIRAIPRERSAALTGYPRTIRKSQSHSTDQGNFEWDVPRGQRANLRRRNPTVQIRAIPRS